jgi:hypothetical protein
MIGPILENLGMYTGHHDQQVASSAQQAVVLTEALHNGQISRAEYLELVNDLQLLEGLADQSEAAQTRQNVNFLLSNLVKVVAGVV